MKLKIAFLTVTILTGCATALKINIENTTDQTIGIEAYSGGHDKSNRLYNNTLAGKQRVNPPDPIATLDEGADVEFQFSLPNGGLFERNSFRIPSRPWPWSKPFTYAKQVGAPIMETIKIDSPESIQDQLLDIKGSYSPDSTDYQSVRTAVLGTVYVQETVGSVTTFKTIATPGETRAGLSQADFSDLLPRGGYFKILLSLDKSAAGQLQAKEKNLAANLSLDFSNSVVYKVEFTLQDTAWMVLPYSWRTVEGRLRADAPGRQILKEIRQNLAQGKKVFFCKRVFVLGRFFQSKASARAVQVGMEVQRGDFFHANGAYRWNEAVQDSNEYGHSVLRMGLDEISVSDDKPESLLTTPASSLKDQLYKFK